MTRVINNFKDRLSDKTVGKIFLFFIVIYVLCYGVFVSKGIHFDKFNLLSMLLTIFLIDSIKTIIECAKGGKFYEGHEDLSKVTVIIPSKDGGSFLEETIQDLLKRFESHRIIIVSNGSTDDTCERARKYGVTVIDHPNAIGKVSAINMALDKVTTPYTLIMDDDTLIGHAIIPTQALDDGFDGVAFRVFPKVSNWLSKIQMYEYRKSMDIGRRFHNENATVQSISGAIGLFHTKELLRQVDLHTGEFSGEDLQRTLLIHLSGSPRGVVISDSIIETEVPTSINSLYMQRVYGWNPGLLSNLFKYLNLLLRSKRTPSLLRYEAFYYSILVISIDPLRLIAFPLIIFYPLYFVIIYLVYVVIETIPYLTMNRQDPYWIILIYPFYGLFGFITRIVSIAVFMYRRCAVIANRSPELDDYKNCGFTSKFASMFVVSLLGIYVVALPTYYGSHSQESLIPQPQNIAPIEQVSNNTEAARNKEEVAGYYDEAVEKTVIPESYIIPLEYGDGKTNIARKAIFEYTIGADIFLSPEQQKYTEDSLRRKIIEDLPRYKPGIVVELPSNMIIEEIYNVY